MTRIKPLPKAAVPVLAMLAGFGLIVAGLYLLAGLPAALIVAGLVLFVGGLVVDVG